MPNRIRLPKGFSGVRSGGHNPPTSPLVSVHYLPVCAAMALREVMEQRVVEILQSKKEMWKMTVADIARAVGRHNTTIYRV